MLHTFDVAVLVGSLRKDSYSRRVARALIDLAPDPLRLATVDLEQLAFYNEDHEADPPDQWRVFRQRVFRSSAVLFISPEYNRSIPAALKNAIDVGSRPVDKSVWNGKPGAVITVSPRHLGACCVGHHLRQSLAHLNVPAMPHPEAYPDGVAHAFDGEGRLRMETTADYLRSYLQSFVAWIEANSPREVEGGSGEEGQEALLGGGVKERRANHATPQARHAAVQFWPQSDKPQASHRDWPE